MFCTYILHQQHGQFFGAHSQFFCFNNLRYSIFLHSVDILYIWSQSRYKFWFTHDSFNTFTLQCCATSKIIIAFLVVFHFKHFICQCLQVIMMYTNRFILFKEFLKFWLEVVLYKLSAILCNLLVQLLRLYCGSSKLRDSN